MIWQKIQHDDLTQSGKKGQLPAIAVLLFVIVRVKDAVSSNNI
jgi:hypothetical protein